MAYTGMSYLMVAPIEKEEKDKPIKYGKGRYFGEPISSNVSLERANVKLQAGNKTVESDNSITGGTITLDIDQVPEDCLELMGFIKDDDGLYHKLGKATPYLGFGYIRDMILGGKYFYEVNFFHKSQFDMTSINGATKQQSMSFQTTQLAGTLMATEYVVTHDDDWYVEKTFDVKSAAIDFLKTLVSYKEEQPEGGEA